MAEPTERDNDNYRDAYRRFVASHGADPRSRSEHFHIAINAVAAAREEGRREGIEECAKKMDPWIAHNLRSLLEKDLK